MNTKPITYADVLRVVKESSQNLYVAVIYVTGTVEWLPVDKVEYVKQLELIYVPDSARFPCYFEVESDGQMFIHPKAENFR